MHLYLTTFASTSVSTPTLLSRFPADSMQSDTLSDRLLQRVLPMDLRWLASSHTHGQAAVLAALCYAVLWLGGAGGLGLLCLLLFAVGIAALLRPVIAPQQ